MNGPEEAGGATKGSASINKHMSNLPTPSDRAKTVYNGRETIFGYMTDDDDKERTAFDEANDLKTIIDTLTSAKQDEQEVPRPLHTTPGTPSAATEMTMVGN